MGRLSIISYAVIPALVAGQLHFVSLGNFGQDTKDQKMVANALKRKAANPPISLILSPGSNFMAPVTCLDDKKWETQFENVYGDPNLRMQFLPTLGVWDWEGNVTAQVLRTNQTYGHAFYPFPILDEDNTTAKTVPEGHKRELSASTWDAYREHNRTIPLYHMGELSKSGRAPVWTLPNYFYHHVVTFPDASSANAFKSAPEVSTIFIFIDTRILHSSFMSGAVTSSHWNLLKTTIFHAAKSYDWVIVVGDQCIYSSGKNGNQRFYVNALRPLLKEANVDAYISGGDFDMEIIEDGVLTHITCGSASSGAGMGHKHDGSVFFTSKTGYCQHTLTQTDMTTRFIDGATGKTLNKYKKKINQRLKPFQDRMFHLDQIPLSVFMPLPAGIGGTPGGMIGFRKPNKWFIIIVGTLGLLAASFIATAGITSMTKRFQKYLNKNK